MSNAGKLVKGMLKAKKESVMGKLGDSPYEDPMEPWSAKYAQPVKEESLNEDSLLMKYIKSLGFNPEFMSFAQRSSYARSNAFKRFKTGHTFDAEKQNIKKEETVAEGKEDKINQLKQDHATAVHWSKNETSPQKREAARQKAEKIKRHLDTQYKQGVAEGSQPNDIAVYHHTGPNADKKAQAHAMKLGSDYGHFRHDKADKNDNLHIVTQKRYFPDYAKQQGVAEGAPIVVALPPIDVRNPKKDAQTQRYMGDIVPSTKPPSTEKRGVKGRPGQRPMPTYEEVEQLDEAGTGLLMSFIKSKGLNPLTMDGNQKKAYSRSSEFRIFKMRHVKETSGMGERGDDWNEEKKQVKEAVDEKDTVTMDIPLLIRVLEFIREDVKTDMDLHRVVENLIDLRTEGVLTMDHYDQAVKINMKEEVVVEEVIHVGHRNSKGVWIKTSTHSNYPDAKKAMDDLENQGKKGVQHRYDNSGSIDPGMRKLAHEEVKQIEELSKETLGSYVTKVATGPSRGMTQKGTLKSIKAIGGVTKAIRKQYEKPLSELKKQDDNMELDDRITREEKSMKGADPCWKGYQMVGTKKKGGRSVPNCVPESVQEGIGGIEDSPMSATNSVKAMESEHRKKNMKSARIIKSIYKKKGKNESMYDWEKTDKGGKTTTAKITLQGGTTMTGKPRDTVEIEPVLKTRPNSQNNK